MHPSPSVISQRVQAKRLMAIGLLVASSVLLSADAFGRSLSKLETYIMTTSDQKYDFVMRSDRELPPEEKPRDKQPGRHAKPHISTGAPVVNIQQIWKGGGRYTALIIDHHNQERAINARYPSSGLYPHGSNVPLWTIDWHDDTDVVVSEDGHHLARIGTPNTPIAITFYRDGKEFKQWALEDLRDFNLWCHLTDHPLYSASLMGRMEYYQRVRDALGEVRIETNQGQEIQFNLSTGEITEQTEVPFIFRPPRVT